MTEHTKEPWFHDGDAVYNNADCVGDPIAHVLTCAYDNDLNHIDARRIVACVNACAGLQTEYLEKVGLPEFSGKALCTDAAQQELDRVTAQRDQLLAAAVDAYELLKVIHDETGKVGSKLHAAIAAVKGE